MAHPAAHPDFALPSPPLSQSARNLAFLVALASLVGVLAYGLSRRPGGPRGLLESAPTRALIMAEVTVPSLRASPLFRDLVGSSDAGLTRLRERCGFDPLDALQTVQVFVLGAPRGEPAEEPTLDDVAFLARGTLDHEALARCVGDVVAGEGGGVHRTNIEGAEAIASDHGSSVAAFVGADGVAAGTDVVVAELLRIQAGATAPTPRDEGLMRLLRRVGTSAHIRLVARLPARWRDFLLQLGGASVEALGLDALGALGLGARLEEGLTLSVALDLGTHSEASRVADALRARITEARRDPEIASSALSIALARVEVRPDARDLLVHIALDRPELDATVALLRRWLARERWSRLLDAEE